ncbi:hypothetical protein C8F01DRAFT_307435 [Mycena amicta]|nr:hypothetical protein C8F01DRAFT_307435 [Mycena amicta]
MYAPSIASTSSGSSTRSLCSHCRPNSIPSSPVSSSPSMHSFGRGGAGARVRSAASLASPPRSPSCTCGHQPLSRMSTKSSSVGSQSISDASSRVRFTGRGGAGSRARLAAEKSPNNKTPSLLSRESTPNLSMESPESLPVPTSSLAKRRGTVLAPLVLQQPPTMTPPVTNTPPPLSATSTASSSDIEAARTPRTPYFYFDDAFEATTRPPSSLSSPTPSTTLFRRIASRTQGLFTKDLSVKQSPLPMAHLSPAAAVPLDPTLPTKPHPSPTLSASSNTSSDTSEWFDTPESPTDSDSATPIVVELPSLSSRNHPASEATVQAGTNGKGERVSGGKWNRDDVREVIMELRRLK